MKAVVVAVSVMFALLLSVVVAFTGLYISNANWANGMEKNYRSSV